MLRRYGFLFRFAILTLVLSVGTALVLSRVLVLQQQSAVNRDIINTSLGRVSAALTPLIATANVHAALSNAEYQRFGETSRQLTNFDEYMLPRGLAVYRTDGTVLFPSGAPPQTELVQRALKTQDFVRGPLRVKGGTNTFAVYEPLGNPNGPGFAAVAAVDFSQDQMAGQSARTQRLVFTVTWGATAVIFLSLLAFAIAAQRELNRRQRLADETFTQTMTGLAAIVDKRDPYTAGHSKRVSDYAVACAHEMNLKPSLIQTIAGAALLHDLGKIGIPDAVLLKPASLDERERSIIGRHPEIAGEILAGVEAMCEIVPCIVHHHERWDGRGYPRKLAGAGIPLGARIIAVADTFDAMTTDRPYRRALSSEIAREELLRGAGVQWDAACVGAFVSLIDRGLAVPPPPITEPELLTRAFGPQVRL